MRNSERRVSMIPSEKIILDNLDNLVEHLLHGKPFRVVDIFMEENW